MSEKVIGAEVIARAWQDPAFKEALVSDPVSTLREAGMEVPVRVTVLENTTDVVHVAIPVGASAGDVAAELEAFIPLPAGQELRLHQSTDEESFFILPLPSDEVNEEALDAVVGGYAGTGNAGLFVGGNGGNGGVG